MLERIKNYFRKICRKLSREELTIRLMGIRKSREDASEPGVVIIQVDGLSFSQLRKGLSRARLPFMQSLINRYRFSLKPFYSGQPSTTPAVQGELFYGVKAAVPAFAFIDRSLGQRQVMFYPASAGKVAGELAQTGGTPLLKKGASYSNIYIGGADEARYCVEAMNLESLLQSLNPLKFVLLALLHVFKVFRVLGVSILELVIAVWDLVKGVGDGKNFAKELKFVPSRVFICIVLRELIRFRVKMDLAQGVPVIHANFTGYDEQAHRRGPGSSFAHWTLKGIDWVIEDIHRQACHSGRRDYRLIVFSDHGQEAVRTYGAGTDKDLRKKVWEAVRQIVPAVDPDSDADGVNGFQYLYSRARVLWPWFRRNQSEEESPAPDISIDGIRIAAMGPLGHIYLSMPLGREKYRSLARLLVTEADIPLVLFKNEQDGVISAVTNRGIFDLEKDKAEILGYEHPFINETAEDLKAVVYHANAGDLIISGWSPHQTPLSFAIENGAHGGPGIEETRGFVLLPEKTDADKSFLRPLDLRHVVASIMHDHGTSASSVMHCANQRRP